MSNEARIMVSLQINKDNIMYQSYPNAYTMDVADGYGPSPGAFLVAVTGTDVDMSELVHPGLCYLYNMDDTNYVEYGVKDPDTGVFYPIGEIGPGECYVIKLTRNLGQDYPGTGVGTGVETNTFHFKANTASVWCRVDAFES